MTARRLLIGGGVAVMLFAMLGAIIGGGVNLVGVLIFLVAVLVLHDGVFLPAVLGLGALVHRFVPASGQAWVRAAGVVTIAVLVVAFPLLLGFGRLRDNPSVLPRSYGWGTFVILVLIWGATFAIRKGLARRRPAGGK